MPITGTTVKLTTKLTNPATKAPEDAPPGSLSLVIVDPEGGKHSFNMGQIAHDGAEGSGEYRKEILGNISGLWHYRWLVNNEAADEGTFEMESEFGDLEDEEPDLTDLRVLVPRARRKIEGPFGPVAGTPPLTDSIVYQMVADGCAEIIMLTGKLFAHELKVKARDPLVGFPTEWQTEEKLDEWETAIIVAQVALTYYFHLFRGLRTKEAILNEGTSWEWETSPGVIKNYLQSIVEERDKAIQGLRVNRPVLDRFVSNIRVRDQATVTMLEWWDTNSPGFSGGGLPGGQEASVIPAFYPGP